MTKIIFSTIGKPNCGKTTFLNSACLTDAKVGDFPFTTIDANKGVAYVKKKCVCKELNVKDNPKNSVCIEGYRFIPINLLDVAGLVPDAHKGKGLGNKFLSDLSRADVLLHILDITGALDKSGRKVSIGFSDPYEDIVFLENEINLWFKEILEREDWNRFIKIHSRDKKKFIEALHSRLSGMKIKKNHIITAIKKSDLDKKYPADWSEENLLLFTKNLRELSKPILIVANKIDKEISLKNLESLEKSYKGQIIPCSALAEHVLKNYHEDKKIHYIPGSTDFQIVEQNKLNSREIETLKKIKKSILDVFNGTGVQNALNYAAFKIANLISVYPVADLKKFSDKSNNILPDVFLVKKGTLLRDFVRKKIHSDLAKHFIYGIDARTNRKLGENYELKDNDVIKIVSAK